MNISSIAGLFAVPVRTAYCASKFGLKAYYQSLRLEQEYLQTNVKVTNVYPGSTQTDVSKNARLVWIFLFLKKLNFLNFSKINRVMEVFKDLQINQLLLVCLLIDSRCSCQRQSRIKSKKVGFV